MNVDELIEEVIAREGGYVNHPADPGGATRWGVTERLARAHGYRGPMRDYPRGEAVSVYRRSAGLFGLEMHSPIMCIGHGVPALVGRFGEETSKGIMWKDIGLGEWLFDMDVEADRQRLVPAVLAMARDPVRARAKAAAARRFVERQQRETMAVLARSLA